MKAPKQGRGRQSPQLSPDSMTTTAVDPAPIRRLDVEEIAHIARQPPRYEPLSPGLLDGVRVVFSPFCPDGVIQVGERLWRSMFKSDPPSIGSQPQKLPETKR